MLMIFSDFYKASWQLIYPAVVFAKGAVSSESRFCQTAGFMMSMGIEASGTFHGVFPARPYTPRIRFVHMCCGGCV